MSRPLRIVSHTCSNTEIVCALGAAADLVGVDEHSDHPVSVVESLPRIGPDLDIDVDRVLALKPDIVLTSLTVPGHERGLERLRAGGLNLLVCDPLSLEDVAQDMETIGRAIGRPSQGLELARRFRAGFTDHSDPAGPSILVEWWPKPVIVPGRYSWVSEMIHLAGGRNPWADKPVKSLPVELSEASRQQPQAIVMSWCGVAEQNYRSHIVHRRSGWEQLPALRHQRIFPISEALLGRPGPRLVEGFERLRQVVRSCHEGSDQAVRVEC